MLSIVQVSVVLVKVPVCMMKALAKRMIYLKSLNMRRQHIDLPFLAGGFSFGAHVMVKCYAALPVELQPSKVILCGLPTATVAGLRHYVTPQIKGDILFIHGEADDVTLLSDMIEWAKPQRHLVTILPGANHFFTGYLKQLRIAMSRFLALS